MVRRPTNAELGRIAQLFGGIDPEDEDAVDEFYEDDPDGQLSDQGRAKVRALQFLVGLIEPENSTAAANSSEYYSEASQQFSKFMVDRLREYPDIAEVPDLARVTMDQLASSLAGAMATLGADVPFAHAVVMNALHQFVCCKLVPLSEELARKQHCVDHSLYGIELATLLRDMAYKMFERMRTTDLMELTEQKGVSSSVG